MTQVDFTILIPSRNRAQLLERAIQSVLRQERASFEVLVIDDGSDGDQYDEYHALAQRYAGKVRVVHLDRRTAPHGKSRAINTGVAEARGTYVGFLDDDDYWITSDHLRATHEAIAKSDRPVDVVLSNQEASRNGEVGSDFWLAAMGRALTDGGVAPDVGGMYWVTPQLLLQQPGFAHTNTMIVRQALFTGMHGFDETLWYEEDRDFYLRLVDQAESILYCTNVTSHHSIPDQSKKENMSTRVSSTEKLLNQLAYFNKNLLFARRPEVRDRVRLSKRYALKDLATLQYEQRDFTTSFHFAREALLIGFTWKWLLYSAWVGVRSLTSPNHNA